MIEYAPHEKETIANLMSSDAFCNKSWGEDALIEIRKRIKDYYKEKQDFTCPYCKSHLPIKHGMAWDIEHIIPLESNPQFMFEPLNLCVACKDCNLYKSNKPVLNSNRSTFPDSSKNYKIVHPHFDDYESHIFIIVAGELYKPITEKGMYTIETCKLYRFFHKVDRSIPNDPIQDLAKAILTTEGFARKSLEDMIVEQIKQARQTTT
ncbi:HNH endonuclease [Shewanella khirikhana]|uniref:HNH endonuclease n=1 Tax=Shewanella khirikhana TaxID=1965282 RepID=A0ABM7DR90_9GAMM|nr:HNH endonuclease signature motif containing protein [Shewanella khirikhana]AZQ12213.1 HNH endonuclease [Shewanella khirikhana]